MNIILYNLLTNFFLLQSKAAKSVKNRKRIKNVQAKIRDTIEQSVRAETLNTIDHGYLQPDYLEESYQVTQDEIVSAVSVAAASKRFDLQLDYGPYKCNYFRNGRQLLIGGSLGHVACFDWLTKKLKCEFNVQQSVHAVQFLHIPSMYAVAQKDWTFIYDSQGIELHCLKKLYRIRLLDYLPFHFLLVSASDTGFLSWMDTSTGDLVKQFRVNHSSNVISAMCQNRRNAIIHTAHPNGTVALWSPNETKPLVKMLANESSLTGIDVSFDGTYMATVGSNRSLKIFDLRTYNCLVDCKLRCNATAVKFSQRGILGISLGNVVETYQGLTKTNVTKPYIRHKLPSRSSSLQFCPYEDVLGVAHEKGFASLLVPGSGEANFDAYESNPYMTTSQQREMEVKALLDKIQPQLICLNADELTNVDVGGILDQAKVNESQQVVKKKKSKTNKSK